MRWDRHVVFMMLLPLLLGCQPATAQETILHERISHYNHIVVTENYRGLRTLRFQKGGARQSVVKVGDPDHLELPYAQAMPVALAFVDAPQRILIIGLGGGTIPSFLHKHYPQTRIDVVDIDPDVVDVARKYFGFQEDPRLQAYVADGRRFIEECRDPYDLIFLDAFDRDSIPYHLATREFLRATRKALKPDGVVASNIWSSYTNALHDSMLRTYRDVFPDVYLVEVQGAGNEIVLALPRRRAVTRDDLASRASRISREQQFRFEMGDVVQQGFRSTQQMDLQGRILTDSDPRADEKKKAG
jgi:spermidine synthase